MSIYFIFLMIINLFFSFVSLVAGYVYPSPHRRHPHPPPTYYDSYPHKILEQNYSRLKIVYS